MFLDGGESRQGNLRFGLKWLPVFAGNVCMAECGMKAILDRVLYLAELNNQCKVQYKLLSVLELARSDRVWECLYSTVLHSFHTVKWAHGG